MTKSTISLLGSLFVAGALAAAGCGGGSGGGTGGKGDAGTGGKGGTGGTGTGGKADGGTGGMTGTGGKMDGGTGGMTMDGSVDTTPCTTSFGAGNQVLFNFDKGANTGWSAGGSLASSLGGDPVGGNTCPGELTLSVPFMSYGDPPADVGFGFGSARDWTGFAKLHAYVKMSTTNFTAVNGVQIYIQSNGYAIYTNGSFLHGTPDLADGAWHRLDFDFAMATPKVQLTAINKMAFRFWSKARLPKAGFRAPHQSLWTSTTFGSR